MRLASVDILRAITMLLMIWVNDYAGVPEVPKWMLHADAKEDYLGFSDIIFPIFLFIVGLSIPLAIQRRVSKGYTSWATTKHILTRGFSLLLIGVYMVNYGSAPDDLYLLGKQGWCFVMAIAVCLIWMDWRRSPVNVKYHKLLQWLGIFLLIFLAGIYAQSGSWMETRWWGILGLIGWAYLANALIFLFTKGNFLLLVLSCLAFLSLSVLNTMEILPILPDYLDFLSILYGGATPALTSLGVISILLYQYFEKEGTVWVLGAFFVLAMVLMIFGLTTRSIWGISKIQATPSWLAICSSIGLITFALLYYIADVLNLNSWARLIMPAGTATLTCYLIPYFVYPFKEMTSFYPFSSINSGAVGLLLSLAFAFLLVIFTGWLEKKGFKLKL